MFPRSSSLSASVPTSQIEQALAMDVPVVRAMPNTPCALGCGLRALCKGKFADAGQMETACALFSVVGRTVVVDEKHMDAVTGLSASGPAYIYIILESLAEAGVSARLYTTKRIKGGTAFQSQSCEYRITTH
jgi:pyrroline-5-carboxylate reductase